MLAIQIVAHWVEHRSAGKKTYIALAFNETGLHREATKQLAAIEANAPVAVQVAQCVRRKAGAVTGGPDGILRAIEGHGGA
ncbi:MAG: hypothetical protein JRH17_02960 [Deltaproteobacteria bacterium]|nr:hypothetical protein [Deltaproteobacteria bacterium]MBW2695003.1 hypothetical protein [Deltaproteobacteria bacterium]